MALNKARNTQTVNEKRYYTLQLLESSVQNGNAVNIYEVDDYSLSNLNDEHFGYDFDKPLDTFIIFEERPNPKFLQKFGWYREDADIIPTIAFIPTHLLINKETNQVENFTAFTGATMKELVENSETSELKLKEIYIKRGVLIDVKYDFLTSYTKEIKNEAGQVIESNDGFSVENKINRFFVADVKTDLVSLNYVAYLVPYKYDLAKPVVPPNVDNKGNDWLIADDTKTHI